MLVKAFARWSNLLLQFHRSRFRLMQSSFLGFLQLFTQQPADQLLKHLFLALLAAATELCGWLRNAEGKVLVMFCTLEAGLLFQLSNI